MFPSSHVVLKFCKSKMFEQQWFKPGNSFSWGFFFVTHPLILVSAREAENIWGFGIELQ